MAGGGVVASCEEHLGRPLLGCRECRRLRVELAVRTGKTRKPKAAEPKTFQHGSRRAARNGLCKVRDGGPCDLCAAALERHLELEREARARRGPRKRNSVRRWPADNPADPRHGTVAGYSARCRCEACRAAKLDYERARRQRGLPEGDPRHGTLAGTKAGCRCVGCRAAGAAHSKEMRVKRIAKGGPVPDDKHGTTNGYNYWGCRCDLCRAAQAARQREYARRRRGDATPPPDVAVVVGVDRGVGVQGAPAHGVT